MIYRIDRFLIDGIWFLIDGVGFLIDGSSVPNRRSIHRLVISPVSCAKHIIGN